MCESKYLSNILGAPGIEVIIPLIENLKNEEKNLKN